MHLETLPRYDPDVNKGARHVYHPFTDQILGTVSWVRPGERDEALSINCRLHGCRFPLKRTAQAMTPLGIKQLFRRGLEDCSEGKAGGPMHNAIFYTCLRDYK